MIALDHLADEEARAGFIRHPRSGLLIPIDLARHETLPVAVDLFCGCGGFSLGFMQAGFRVAAGIDNDITAAITYTVNLGAYPMQFHYVEAADEDRLEEHFRKHYLRPPRPARRGHKRYQRRARRKEDEDAILKMPTTGSAWIAAENEDRARKGQLPVPGVEHFILGDISKLEGEEILDAIGMKRGELDAVIGSPPCQGFSTANTRRSKDDPRNDMMLVYARLVVEMQPKAVCLENVPGVLRETTPDGVPILDEFCRILEDGGMGGRDALRKAIAGTAGCGVAFLKRPTPRQAQRKNRTKAKPTAPTSPQVELAL